MIKKLWEERESKVGLGKWEKLNDEEKGEIKKKKKKNGRDWE